MRSKNSHCRNPRDTELVISDEFEMLGLTSTKLTESRGMDYFKRLNAKKLQLIENKIHLIKWRKLVQDLITVNIVCAYSLSGNASY